VEISGIVTSFIDIEAGQVISESSSFSLSGTLEVPKEFIEAGLPETVKLVISLTTTYKRQ
jgi:hypothetical protein